MPSPPEDAGTAVLELDGARPVFEQSGLPQIPFALRLMPGDCVLVEAIDPRRGAALADLCSGLLAITEGQVRFLGLDWDEVGETQGNALRGRIGRVHGRGAWTEGRGADHDILLPLLHHTRIASARLVQEGLDLARRFGLPGLPVGQAGRLSDADAARAACVRAFLGTPSLLLLENPVTTSNASLLAPLLRAVTDARDRGAAVLCMTRERRIWQPYHPYLTGLLRLHDHGIGPAGMA